MRKYFTILLLAIWPVSGGLLAQMFDSMMAAGFFKEGEAMLTRDQADSAIALTGLALELWRSAGEGHEGKVATYLETLGKALSMKEETDAAVDSLQAALLIWKNLGKAGRKYQARTFSEIGAVYLEADSLSQAKVYLDSALQILKVNEVELLRTTYHGLGAVAVRQGRFEEGWNYLEKALQYPVRGKGPDRGTSATC